jgi:serine/threonine-protein kinase
VTSILQLQGQRSRTRIKGYEMVSKLGQGATGAVYRATQLSLDRPVALKVLSPALAADETYIQRFLREARAVAKLNHPNIIRGIDVGRSGGWYYFAMEFVDGPTLAEVLRDRGPVEEPRALRIIEDIAKALEHAHRHGLIHRDVKPDNIMITAVGDAKLCDLGLAKSMAGDAGGSETKGMAVGTPHYISPEQALGDEVDIRSDIYSLGGTLFHALTGRTPFLGGEPRVVMTKHVTEPVDDPRDYRPEISEPTAFMVLKMMEKDSGDRYTEPVHLLDDVKAIRRGEPPPNLREELEAGKSASRGTGKAGAPKRRVHRRRVRRRRIR